MKLALMELGPYPSDYKYMADINHWGPDVLGEVLPPASFTPFLTPLSARNHVNERTLIVDARQFTEFNQQHIAGAFAIAFGDTFVTWSGWLPWG